MRHIKAKHTNPSQKQVFDEMEKNFKKHSHNKRNQASQKKQKEVDEKGFNTKNKKAVQACQKKQKEVDEERFKQQHNKAEQARKKRLKEADEEGFNIKNKKFVQACQKKQKGSQAAAVKKFYQETCYGPVFECVCCRTLNFKHNVVEFNKKNRVQIRKKAKEAHTRDYNSKLEQVNL